VTVGSAVSQVLLPAIATAVNPVPIMAVVALLGSRHPRRNATMYLFVMLLVIVVVGMIDIYVAKNVSQSQTQGSGGFQLLVGLLFLAAFVMNWRKKPDASGETQVPKWMQTVDTISVIGVLVLGVALVNYALVSTAVAGILSVDASKTEAVTAFVVYIVISMSTIVAPLVYFLVAPKRSEHLLAGMRVWLLKHNRTILLWVFGLMGGLFVAEGLIAIFS
jgi:hypothetical protein